MTYYEWQAKDFLESCNARISIDLVGKEPNPLWNDDKPRNKYSFVITTPKGKMQGIFWDNLYRTELSSLSYDKFLEKLQRKSRNAIIPMGTPSYTKFRNMKLEAKPSAYDILACLEKYDVGSIDDFMHDFGYEIRSTRDFTNLLNAYNAVIQEYNDLCRIFTPEQIKILREIY